MEYRWKRVNKIFSLFSHLPDPSLLDMPHAWKLKCVYPRCLLDAYLVRTWCVISPIPLNVLSILLVLLFCFSIVIIRWLAPFFSSFTFRYSLMNRGSSSWYYWSASLMTAIAWFGFGCKSVLIGSICNLFINFKNFGNKSQFQTVSDKIR